MSALSGLAAFSKIGIASEGDATAPLCTFIKPVQHLSWESLCRQAAESGLTGLEVPVRPKGYILPEDATLELPKFAKVMRAHGLDPDILTTSITGEAESSMEKRVLEAGSAAGFQRFRMGYFRYDLRKPIAGQRERFAEKLDRVVQLGKEFGVKPVYQNHSGKDFFGGPIWDLAHALDSHSPEEIGVCFDIGHALIENTYSWQISWSRVSRYIDSLYLKDPVMKGSSHEWVRLGKGMVSDRYYDLVNRLNFNGAISLHIEYLSEPGEEGAAFFNEVKHSAGFLSKRIKKVRRG